MNHVSRPDSYDRFADVYERHWTVTSRMFIPTVALLLLPRLRADALVLDLCCGTGILAADLSDTGLRVVGLDGSLPMLSYARKRAPGVALVQADARSFGLRQVFDAAVCMFDSLNHMLTARELGAAFECVRESLRPGGWFLFDLNTEAAYLKHWNGTHRLVDADEEVTTSAQYDRFKRIGAFSIAVERKGKGCRPERGKLTLLQRCHSDEEVRTQLRRSGLLIADTHALEGKALASVAGAGTERVFYLCRKP